MRGGSIDRIRSPLQVDFDNVASRIIETLDVDIALVSLYASAEIVSLGLAPNTGRLRGLRRHLPSDMICLHVLEEEGPLALPDATAVTKYKDIKYVKDGFVTGYLGVPIRNAEIGAVGAVCAVTSSPRTWRDSDLHYLTAVAQSVENMILREMYRLESADASSLASEYDKIIAAFSAVRADPTSIHDRDGRVVFANRALSEQVSVFNLPADVDMAIFAAPLDGEPVRIAPGASGLSFCIERTETTSGYFVCRWIPERVRLN